MGFSPADRSKLAAVLGLLGSPHQGERDAAALAADRLVRGRGLAWSDVLGGAETSRRREVSPPPPPPPAYHGPCADHVGNLATCAQRPDLLTSWEAAFLRGLAGRKLLSSRQREILAEMAAKVRAAGPRRG